MNGAILFDFVRGVTRRISHEEVAERMAAQKARGVRLTSGPLPPSVLERVKRLEHEKARAEDGCDEYERALIDIAEKAYTLEEARNHARRALGR